MMKKILPLLTMTALAPFAAAQNVSVEAEAPIPSPEVRFDAGISDEKKAEFARIFGSLVLSQIGLGEAGLSDIEREAFLKGVEDALKDPDVVKKHTDFIKANDEAFSNYLSSLQQRVQEKMMEAQMKAREQQAEKNKAAGEAYIEKCLKDKSFVPLKGGTLIKVIDAGDAAVPVKPTSMLTVRYTGTFVDGEIFDSSDCDPETGESCHFTPESEPTKFPFPLENLIPGWIEALTTVGKGAKVALVIPPEQAYGDTGPLPPASTLVFDIEIVDVEESDSEKQEAEEAAELSAALDAAGDDSEVEADVK